MSDETDVLVDAMQVALRRLNARLGEDGWDQPPSLWLVHRELGPPGPMSVFFEFAQMVPQGAPEFRWEGHPTDVLAEIAERAAVEGMQGPHDPDAVAAVVFASEAWMAVGDSPRLRQAVPARQLHTLDERVEVRVLSAVDTAGYRYMHVLPRGGTDEDRQEAATREGRPTRGAGLSGYIYQSLTTLLEALT